MTSCRDNARQYLRSRFAGADGILKLWECFVEQCPEMDLVAAALDQLAGFHDYHGQPLQADRYRQEAAALRKQTARQTEVRP